MKNTKTKRTAEARSGSLERVVRPVLRKTVTLKANLTACTLTMYDAREQIANELRRIADMVEEGDTLSESGNMGICDYGSWQLPDPWEGSNDRTERRGAAVADVEMQTGAESAAPRSLQ